MTKMILVYLVTLSVVSSCTRIEIENGTPKCVKVKIIEFNKTTTCADSKVDEYIFQNRVIFVFSPGTCGADMQSSVIDSDCILLGDLGGFVGNSDINGESFENAVFVKNIWKKEK